MLNGVDQQGYRVIGSALELWHAWKLNSLLHWRTIQKFKGGDQFWLFLIISFRIFTHLQLGVWSVKRYDRASLSLAAILLKTTI